MSRKLAYCEVLYELELDEDFIEEVIGFLNKVNAQSTCSEANAITGLLDYWLSNDELTCYQFDMPILNEDVSGGIVYGDSGKPNESLHKSLRFDAQELINKIKSIGLDLPGYLKEQEEFIQICLREIDWNDWVCRKNILIEHALMLSKKIDPDYFEDPDQFDQDDKFALEVKQWIKDKKLIPNVTFIDGGSCEYRIEPLSFFNLARQNGWPLPKELHDILDDFLNTQSVIPCGDTQSPGALANPKGIDDKPTNKKPSSKLIEQQCAILQAIIAKGLNPMSIPDGEKGTIKIICESDSPGLFSSSSFDRAWKKGIGIQWQMEFHDRYARRGKN